LFGIPQAVAFYLYSAWWILPLFGFCVGYVTNVFALLAIFRPLYPKKAWWTCGFTLHGAFIRRQEEVSKRMARFSESYFFKAERIWGEVLDGGKRAAFDQLVKRVVRTFVHQEMIGDAVTRSAANLILGQAKMEKICDGVAEALALEFPRLIPLTYEYTEMELDVVATIENSLKNLPPEEYEGVLRPAFKEDEFKLFVVGGVLGVIVGFLQSLIPF